MKKISFATITLAILPFLAVFTIVSLRTSDHPPSAELFEDIPSFSPLLALPPSITGGSSSVRPLSPPNTGFQDCLNTTCRGITAFTTEFNVCLRQCFAGHKGSTGSVVVSTGSSSFSSFFFIPQSSTFSESIPVDQPFCIDINGEKTTDRSFCAPPGIQGTVLFPTRKTPTEPINDLIAEFLGVPVGPLPSPAAQPPPVSHDPLDVLTALYTIFQRLPEFLKIITESAVITGTAMDQAYQGYRDARLALLNARTQCAEFYRSSGKTPCTVALRSSVYALGKMRISIKPILAQDIETSRRVAALFKDLTEQWNHITGPNVQEKPSIEIPFGQPFLE